MRWKRVLLWTFGAGLVGLCGGVYSVVPWSPFQSSAGRLDAFVPADVTFALRLDPETLSTAPFVERVAASGELVEWLLDVGLVDAPDTLTSWPAALLGNECVLAGREGGLLAFVRVAGPLHATRLAIARRAAQAAGVRISRTDGATLYEHDDSGVRVYVRQVDDVFVLATDLEILKEAHDAHGGQARALPAVPRYRDALRCGEPAGARLLAWLPTDSWKEALLGAELGVPLISTFGEELLAPERAGAARLVLACDPEETTADVELAWSYPSRPPARAAVEVDVAELARRVGTLGGQTAYALAANVSAADALQLVRLPPALAAPLERHVGLLGEGVARAHARRADADSLAERSEDGAAPAPAPVELFFLPVTDAGAIVAALEEGADREDVAGASLFFIAADGDGDGDAAALALWPDGIALCSSLSHLRAALAATPATPATPASPAERLADGALLVFHADFGTLARMRNDAKWEIADYAELDRLSEHSYRIRTLRTLHDEGFEGDAMKQELERRVLRWRAETTAGRRQRLVSGVEREAAALGALHDAEGSLTVQEKQARLRARVRAR